MIDCATITTTLTSFYSILTVISGTNTRDWAYCWYNILYIVYVELNPSILYHVFFSICRWLYSTNKSYLRQLNYNMNQRRSWWCIATLLPSVWYINTRVVDFLQPASTSTSEQSCDTTTMDNIYRPPADQGRWCWEYVGTMAFPSTRSYVVSEQRK